MTTPSDALISFRDRPVVRFLLRPAVAFAVMVLLFMILFPNFGSKEITVSARVPERRCASALTVYAYKDGELARRASRAIGDSRDMEIAFSLPKGEYALEVELDCDSGGAVTAAKEMIVLNETDQLSFDLSRKCPCESSGARQERASSARGTVSQDGE
jgi:hypothetical protein